MFESLRSLSDRQIISGTKVACDQEHSGMLSLIVHLIELERRDLHLKLGHQSLFKYCVSELGYCESSAMRRITVARCVAAFPEVYSMLESRQIKMSTVARVSKLLTMENCKDLLARIGDKSLREVESMVAEYEPETALPRDRVRTVVVRVPVTVAPEWPKRTEATMNLAVPANTSTPTVSATTHAHEYNRNGGKKSAAPDRASDVTLEHRTVVQFTARNEFMDKIGRARSLVWHQLPVATFEQLFELALDELIARRDPVARQKRRQARRSRSTNATSNTRRYVAAGVRDQVLVRDQLQCTFVAVSGRRCASTTALQIDHIKPVARGGASTMENLRVLCAYHNRLEAERLMGCTRAPVAR